MKNLNDIVAVYHKELCKGDILVAYNELVKFVMVTRTELVKKLDHHIHLQKSSMATWTIHIFITPMTF
jgi:hypothetical protein